MLPRPSSKAGPLIIKTPLVFAASRHRRFLLLSQLQENRETGCDPCLRRPLIGRWGSHDLDKSLCLVNTLPPRILMMLCFNFDLHQHIQESSRLNLLSTRLNVQKKSQILLLESCLLLNSLLCIGLQL